jgi:hypothetical protein
MLLPLHNNMLLGPPPGAPLSSPVLGGGDINATRRRIRERERRRRFPPNILHKGK